MPLVAATVGAIAMALAFPRTNAVVLAPLGAMALFWAWFGMSPKRAFWAGWLAGSVYFGITFWWFGETAGALIAPFGFLVALLPAVADAFFGFALAGALVAVAARSLGERRSARHAFVPLAGAAAFAFCEWLRSEGLGEIGVPFGSLGYTQVATVFAPLAAYVGTYGITFVLCALGAYLAYALRLRGARGSLAHAGSAFALVAAGTALAWWFWPARSLAAPTYPVAAIQGDIPQSLKFAPGALERSVTTYERLTRAAGAAHPRLVVWPETVIPVALNRVPELRARFGALAKSIDAELVVGAYDDEPGGEYNELAFFRPDGTLERIYRKRRLVPFAEHIPLRPLFAWIPWTDNISNFSQGTRDEIVAAQALRFGPIICWESAFSGAALGSVRDGAGALIVATDDAWFGTTAGPYQHAQIAQMRALETGRWIVRAASTGISGLIAPDGTYRQESRLDESATVTGRIGPPVTTAYDALGLNAVAFGLAIIYLATLLGSQLGGAGRSGRA
jgi:apolipoprotein N-acyltransferase